MSTRKDIRPKAEFDPTSCPNHGPEEGMPTLACVLCNTFKWNGVHMCGKIIRTSTLEWIGKLRRFDFGTHACTRVRGHEDKDDKGCKFHKLDPSYEPQ